MQKTKNDPFNRWMALFLQDLLETRHLGETAKHFGLSAATASRSLDRLRTAFSDPLFLPNGRGLTPTSRMLSLGPALQATDKALEGLYSPAVFDPATTRRVFRIASRGFIELSFLTLVAGWMRREAPLAKLEHYCRTDASYKLLREEKLDYVVGINVNMPLDTRYRPICPVELGLVLASGHPLLRDFGGGAPPMGEFLKYKRVALQLSRDREDGTFDMMCFGAGDSRVVVTTDEPLAVAGVVSCSDLIMVLPKAGADSMKPFFNVGWVPLPPEVQAAASGLKMIVAWSETQHHDPGSIWMRGLFKRWSEVIEASRFG